MPKNIPNPNELDLLAEGSHTFHPSTYKANTIQILNTTFTFESIITKLNQPVGKGVTVYLYHKGLGTLIAKTETDEDSKIYIPNLSKHNEYMVVAIDPKDIYNSVIFDITFDLSANLSKNPTLKYYSIYDVPNLQKLYAYWDTLSDQRTDPNLLFFISNPNFKDDLDLIWGMNGTVKTTTIKDIRTYTFTNSGEYIYLYHNPVPPKEQFTFSAYIYVDSNNRNTTTDNNVFKQHTQSLLVNSNLKLVYKNTDNFNTINLISESSIILNEWNHVSISFDGDKLYLFLNGILQTSVANSLGMSYTNSTFTIGEGFKGYITQPYMTAQCNYTEDFELLLKAFSYKSHVYSDPTDTIAEYVRIKVTSNKLGYGLRDEVNNISFNSGVKNTNFTSVNTKTRMVAYTKNNLAVLAARNFCIEMKIKIKNVTDNYPKLVLNNNESWTTNNWEFDVNHISYPNTYSLHVYNVGSWAFNYPTIFNELIDLAIVREGTNLRFYVNGFLDRTINVGTTSFDNAANCFIALMYYVNCNFYDFKYTVGHHRYSSNYVPAPLNWADTEIALDQYKTINLPFKQTLSDTQYVFQFSVSGVVLSNTVSINNTKSAYFKNAKIVTNNKLFVNNEKFTFELFYQPKTEALSGTTSIISIQNAFRLGTNAGVLSFFNGTSWEDTTYSLDDTKLNHIVVQRDGTTIKVLAHGNLVLTTAYTFPAGLKTITIGCFNDTEHIDGYINNFIMYKCITKYADTYTVPLEDPVVIPPGEAEPEVIVNEYTTSGLDFENGLIDKVPTTVWNKEGTADITSVNKIFGDNSFETKALGDSLYTNSNVITGGSTPFTIEFYALIKGGNVQTVLPLITKTRNTGNGDQGYYLNMSSGYMFIVNYGTWNQNEYVSYKIKPNELNKITISYDGTALRSFINDRLNFVVGRVIGFDTSSDQPFRIFDNYIPAYSGGRASTFGVIDNINIHDGIATKVRDYDPYEEFLIVDLAFDGENNSTKIVDNGSLKSNWTVNGNAKISTDQMFDGFSSLYIPYSTSARNVTSLSNIIFESDEDFTFSFEFIRLPSTVTFATIFTTGVSNVANSDSVWSINAFSSYYNNTTFSILKNKISFINEKRFSAAKDGLISNITIQDNVKYKVDIVRSGMTTFLYVNNVLDSFTNAFQNDRIGFTNICIGTPVWSNSTEAGISCYLKNVKIYKGIAIPPKQKINSLINVNISSSSVNSNLTWNISNASVSIDYFTGYLLNTSGNNAFTFYGSNFTLKYKFKGYGNLLREWNSNLRYMLSINSSGVVSFNFYETGPTQRTITTNTQTLSSDINELELTRFNGYFFIKLNGIPYTVTQTGAPYSGGIYGPTTEGVVLGDTGVITYSIDIYTEKSEDLDKIQLDFDNNVIDKYGNSTWTNNGVTFDQVNSVIGYSSKYENSSFISSNNTNDLNFGANNFYLSFDSKKNTLNSVCYLFSNNIIHNDASNKAIWFYKGSSTNNFSYIDYKDKPINITNHINTDFPNVWYSEIVGRKSSVLYQVKNDVIILAHNLSNQVFDFRYGGSFLLGKAQWANGADGSFNGYIDNFKSIKDYQEQVVIDKPAVHLPLETNSINIGFSNLTINSVGSPTYTTIDGKKCIKFESGKYLTINSNNIFNLGSSSDFYIEFDVYPLVVSNNPVLFDSYITGSNNTWQIWHDNCLKIYIQGSNHVIASSLVLQLNVWQTIKIARLGNVFTLSIDQKSENIVSNISLSNSQTVALGAQHYSRNSSYDFNGYMSDFKMFVGASEIPETYNDKAVLDLDFKPTRKSYLFKDNNNKCVIHPVNITQRDYQDSQYCCTFNGTDQYLQLGKNDLLNFELDDFVMEFYFRVVADGTWNILLGNGATSSDGNYHYIGISENTNATYPSRVYVTLGSVNVISFNLVSYSDINHLIISREGNTFKLILNEITTTGTMSVSANFNYNSKTQIGSTQVANWVNHLFKGYIYSVKIFRNTSDLTLLE